MLPDITQEIFHAVSSCPTTFTTMELCIHMFLCVLCMFIPFTLGTVWPRLKHPHFTERYRLVPRKWDDALTGLHLSVRSDGWTSRGHTEGGHTRVFFLQYFFITYIQESTKYTYTNRTPVSFFTSCIEYLLTLRPSILCLPTTDD